MTRSCSMKEQPCLSSPTATGAVNTAALVAKVVSQMARWSTLPRCSCLFSTAHPCNEIASLWQFALTQHSGMACRCTSCAGKHWENDLDPALKLSFRCFVQIACLGSVGGEGWSSSLTFTCVTLHFWFGVWLVSLVSPQQLFSMHVKGVFISGDVNVFAWSHYSSCPPPVFSHSGL